MAPAQATVVIDDFSSDSSGKYDTLASRSILARAPRPTHVMRATSSPPRQTAQSGATTGWLRNDGYTLNVGDTISIDVDAVS